MDAIEIMGEITTIQVGKELRDILKAMGKKGDTYNDIIRRLIKKVEYIEFMEKQYEILDKEEEWISIDEI